MQCAYVYLYKLQGAAMKRYTLFTLWVENNISRSASLMCVAESANEAMEITRSTLRNRNGTQICFLIVNEL